ncbi:hypothetical protein ABK040_011169 [Willaertia magna]
MFYDEYSFDCFEKTERSYYSTLLDDLVSTHEKEMVDGFLRNEKDMFQEAITPRSLRLNILTDNLWIRCLSFIPFNILSFKRLSFVCKQWERLLIHEHQHFATEQLKFVEINIGHLGHIREFDVYYDKKKMFNHYKQVLSFLHYLVFEKGVRSVERVILARFVVYDNFEAFRGLLRTLAPNCREILAYLCSTPLPISDFPILEKLLIVNSTINDYNRRDMFQNIPQFLTLSVEESVKDIQYLRMLHSISKNYGIFCFIKERIQSSIIQLVPNDFYLVNEIPMVIHTGLSYEIYEYLIENNFFFNNIQESYGTLEHLFANTILFCSLQNSFKYITALQFCELCEKLKKSFGIEGNKKNAYGVSLNDCLMKARNIFQTPSTNKKC